MIQRFSRMFAVSLLAGLTACAVISASAAPAPSEATVVPTPHGRSINAWIADLDSASPETRANALDVLNDHAAHAKSSLPIITRLLSDTEERVAWNALRIIGKFGPDAIEALPILKKLAREGKRENFRDITIAQAMLAMTRGADRESVRFAMPLKTLKAGFPAFNAETVRTYPAGLVGPLVELLSDTDPIIRATAAESLGHYALLSGEKVSYLRQVGEAGAKISPALTAALADGDPNVRGKAAVSLAAIDAGLSARFLPVILGLLEAGQIEGNVAGRALKPFAAEVQGQLIEMLAATKQDEEYRSDVSMILAGFEPPMLPRLSGALLHKEPKVRTGLVAAIRALRSGAASALADLIRMLADSDPAVRIEAAEAIAEIDRERAQATESALVELLAASKPRHRQRAAQAFGALGDRSKKSVAALIQNLADHDPGARLAAAQALVDIDAQASAPAVPVLLSLGLDCEQGESLTAARALGRIGPPARDTLPKLRELLTGSDVRLAAAAAFAMSRIDPDTIPEVVAALQAVVVEGKAPRYQMTEVLRELGGLGKKAQSAVPALEELLMSKHRFYGPEAAAAILRIESGHAGALAFFRPRLDSGPQFDLFAVSKALLFAGTAGAALTPELAGLLTYQEDATARGTAAQILAAIGPAAHGALPALAAQALRETDPQAKRQMEQAIKAIEAK